MSGAGPAKGRKRRWVARWSDVYIKVFLAGVTALLLLDLPGWWYWVFLGVLALAYVRPPWDRAREPVTVAAPVSGTWLALNSPGSKVPAHGTRGCGQTYAIDVLIPSNVTAAGGDHPRPRFGWGIPDAPESFPAFGAPIHAVADGRVVAATDRQRDHRARNTWSGFLYMLLEGVVRQAGGWRLIFGNLVVLDHGDGVYSAYAHLRRGSLRVRPGDRVQAGRVLGEVGNTGNTSEPHLHFQLMDRPRPQEAAGVPFRWKGATVREDAVAPRYGLPKPGEGEPGLPANAQVFESQPDSRRTPESAV
ncbi:M23 family metallopeptidase [Actinocorallia populi]|uniref:M23 family metallopeptidase n=1 Tax=Actinocorallia populi TaxID=2079200 RepID=UPI000D093F0D|nr:M23 family metallopeptidase [Actinocorallia populi]